ncbi:hypothetical protein [Brevibacillus sp. MER 51]|uniref:hypothetical protein n=1 Tax=Brevibacillus sp. MER 51 TaxID=2939560 RepID=UPI00203B008E|nr:hypothetical protein [Brevibacillus sp. MER 51]MCM3145373.1 hypothetical protein [Brevibacillus sp. MER 51]
MVAKVIQDFRERYQNMKLYRIGDTYSLGDAERVEYLVSQGFLKVSEENDVLDKKELTFEEFAALAAPEQKKVLNDLNIEGDDSNAEKREALYKAHLENGLKENDGNVNADGNTDA